jgi:uncharacterized protein
MATRVGLIADTHGLLRPEAAAALAGSEQILHAGDIGGRDVLDALALIAPVVAVRGNNDMDPWGRTLPSRVSLTIEHVRVLLTHDLNEVDVARAAAETDVIVVGHSHRPRTERRDGVLVVNPGSAGPRRFSLPVAVATMIVDGRGVDVEVRPLRLA